jgi:hypothetical protein
MSVEEHKMIVEARKCSTPHGADVGRHYLVAPALGNLIPTEQLTAWIAPSYLLRRHLAACIRHHIPGPATSRDVVAPTTDIPHLTTAYTIRM